MGPREVRAAMQIQIEGNLGRPIPRAHVTARLRRALSRVPVQPVTAHVRFADVNGPKGGNDIRCVVLVELPGQPAIRVERLASTPRLAFDTSYDRVVRQLERCRDRWQDSQRHPKKYYAAKRLQ
jgi:ribosome-associated translation inhibitor RaiA